MSDFEHADLQLQWKTLLSELSENFGEIEDVKDLIFLIGVQELGQGFRKFSKDEKLDLMHIGLCRVLSEYAYYEYEGHDKDGWPHYKAIKALPELSEKENEILMKQAILNYFEQK